MNARVDARLAARCEALRRGFETVARTRMAGLPVCNTALGVEAIGFAPLPAVEGEPATALGILVTPWFLNLVALPLWRIDGNAGVGRVRVRTLLGQRFEFIGAHDEAVGAFEACSLFSPMFEFADAAAARATAHEVLALLREGAAVAPPAPAARADDTAPEAAPARRMFLFGRTTGQPARP